MTHARTYAPDGRAIDPREGLREWLPEFLGLAALADEGGDREAVRLALELTAGWLDWRAKRAAESGGAQGARAAATLRAWQASVEKCMGEIE